MLNLSKLWFYLSIIKVIANQCPKSISLGINKCKSFVRNHNANAFEIWLGCAGINFLIKFPLLILNQCLGYWLATKHSPIINAYPIKVQNRLSVYVVCACIDHKAYQYLLVQVQLFKCLQIVIDLNYWCHLSSSIFELWIDCPGQKAPPTWAPMAENCNWCRTSP